MECTICNKQFNSVSSFYRHNWSNTHLLMCQVKEYENEIKVLQRKILINEDVINSLSQCHSTENRQATPIQDPFK